MIPQRDQQAGVLKQLHDNSHQGILKSRERARQSVWWPGLSEELEETVKNCSVCIKFQSPRAQPLLPIRMPDLPWPRVGTDLFEWKKTNYLLMIDYFSRWIEIAKLKQTTSQCVIDHIRSIFARHGIPETLISDNGPQYSAERYGFEHITSTPHFPQSNVEAERAVQTVKNLLKPYLAMLAYRSTPLSIGYSPSELLMSRKLRTKIPISRQARNPTFPDYATVKKRDERVKQRQAENFNSHCAARELTTLLPGDTVYVRDRQSTGTVVGDTAPRSYVVRTPEGTVRRNRRHVVQMPPTPRTLWNRVIRLILERVIRPKQTLWIRTNRAIIRLRNIHKRKSIPLVCGVETV